MNEYDVKRLIEMEAIKAEIEGMKTQNKIHENENHPYMYYDSHFEVKAEELRILASKHNEQL